ncbi:MAG: hypothetical protein SWK76_04815 [Actinomycetota bacterium]|nr:hypothetical protein [Actinomycetota bacterium]
MIQVNGREFDEHGLHARAEARKRVGLYDERLLALLDRDIVEEVEEHVFSMIQVVYDLQRSLEERGARLEPPPDLASPGEKPGHARSFLRRMQTRFIRAVNEGYVQQQEKYNTFFTKAVDISYRQLCGAGGGVVMSEAARKRGLWLSRRPQWDVEAVRAVYGLGKFQVVMVGIPGTTILELLREDGRLVVALDNSDEAVAEAQAHFLPAWYHPRPIDILESLRTEELDLLAITFPECLTGSEVEGIIGWSGERMDGKGIVLAGLNRGWSEVLSGDDGFVRYWPRRLLAGLMERHGFVTEDWTAGERRFLKGMKGS